MNFDLGEVPEVPEVPTGNKWIYIAIVTIVLAVVAWYFLYRKPSTFENNDTSPEAPEVPKVKFDKESIVEHSKNCAKRAQYLFEGVRKATEGDSNPEVISDVKEIYKAATIAVQAAIAANNATSLEDAEQATKAAEEAAIAAEKMSKKFNVN